MRRHSGPARAPLLRLTETRWHLVLGLLLTCVTGAAPALQTGAGPEAAESAEQATSTPEAASLPALIHEYLDTEESARAEERLAEILKHPQATLSSVEATITAGPVHGAQLVGLLPGRPVRVKERTFSYGLYVPPSYSPSRSYALVVCLHGAGFSGDAYLERWQTRLGIDYILACPTLIQGTWWTRQAEDLVLATIRTVERSYRIDPDRIFLTGMSNGGIGTYLIGTQHASRFAGLAPMAGGLDDVLLPLLANLRSTPVYIIHGRRDQVMPVYMSRTIVKEFERLGYRIIYREHDLVHPQAGGHFFPRDELPALVSWFDTARRNPYPSRITLVRDAMHLTAFGWVRIDATDRIAAFSDQLVDSQDEALANRVYAKLDAEITAPNRIEVRTERVRRYTLFLSSQLIDFSAPLTVVTNGRVSYDGPVQPSLETLLREARHRQDQRMLFPVKLTISVEGAS